MDNFNKSTNFDINSSYLMELIKTKGKGPLWSQGAIVAYSACIQSMVQKGGLSHKNIAHILDEPEELVTELYNLTPASLAKMTGG